MLYIEYNAMLKMANLSIIYNNNLKEISLNNRESSNTFDSVTKHQLALNWSYLLISYCLFVSKDSRARLRMKSE